MYRLLHKCRDYFFATSRSPAERIRMLLLVGPLFLSSGLLAALIHYNPTYLFLFVAIASGMVGSLKWGVRGAGVSFLLITSVFGFLCIQNPINNAPWKLALLASIGLSFVVMALTNEEAVSSISSTLLSAEVEVDRSLDKIESLRKKLEESSSETEKVKTYYSQMIEEYKAQASESEKKLLDHINAEGSYKMELTLAKEERDTFKKQYEVSTSQIGNLARENALLKAKVEGWEGKLDEYSSLQHEKDLLQFQLHATAAEMHASYEELTHLRDEVAQLKQIEYLYKQLKTQFDEKTEVLSNTRKELFQLEGEIHLRSLEKREESSIEKEEAQFHRDVREVVSENEALKEQAQHLEGIISSLLWENTLKDFELRSPSPIVVAPPIINKKPSSKKATATKKKVS